MFPLHLIGELVVGARAATDNIEPGAAYAPPQAQQAHGIHFDLVQQHEVDLQQHEDLPLQDFFDDNQTASVPRRRLSKSSPPPPPPQLPVPCDPERCVLVEFTFNEAATECASCTPENGKYRCPAASGGNTYATQMSNTFPGGFGSWSLGQCVHRSYDPAFFAFAGPAAWEDDIVPACPPAAFCACDSIRDKVHAVMFDRSSLYSQREQNDLYWASSASGFTAVKGLTQVSGGSSEHLDLIHDHSDSRRQFCSGVQSFTYSPQSGSVSATPDWEKVARENKHEPEFTTSCGFYLFGSNWCGNGYQVAEEVQSDCWLLRKRQVCRPKYTSLQDVTAIPEVKEIS